MTLDDSEAMLLFVDWGSDEDLRHIVMFPEVLFSDTIYGTNREKRPLLVFAGTDHNRKSFTAMQGILMGRSIMESINQINTDDDRQIYNHLANCPCFGGIHNLCNYHMIEKLFSTKVNITDTNRMLVEYCKQWVKTWRFNLEAKEEYDYYFNEFRKFTYSDRGKKELGHAREKYGLLYPVLIFIQ
jgi:hypothetical protein